MSTPTPPLVPLPDDGDRRDDVPRQEVDGEPMLDPDVDADQVDGASADRLAAEQGSAEEDDA